MSWSEVVGQPRVVDALKAALKGGSLHHAYLFAGPEGAGKEQTAFALAQALLCPKRPGEGCGECAVCGRVSRHNHPDVSFLMPEDEMVARGLAGRSDFTNTPSREIRVEQVRGLQERLSLRALEGAHKVAIIASADRLNPQAQNALLKTLEEPPAGTVLVLIAAAPDKLLPAVRSRCSRLSFAPLPLESLAEKLGTSAARKAAIEAFEAVKVEDARTILRFAEDFGGSREDAEEALRILALWFRDLAVVRAGEGKLVHADLEGFARTCAQRVDASTLHRRYGLLEQAASAISARNGSPRLQLERMLIRMGEG